MYWLYNILVVYQKYSFNFSFILDRPSLMQFLRPEHPFLFLPIGVGPKSD